MDTSVRAQLDDAFRHIEEGAKYEEAVRRDMKLSVARRARQGISTGTESVAALRRRMSSTVVVFDETSGRLMQSLHGAIDNYTEAVRILMLVIPSFGNDKKTEAMLLQKVSHYLNIISELKKDFRNSQIVSASGKEAAAPKRGDGLKGAKKLREVAWSIVFGIRLMKQAKKNAKRSHPNQNFPVDAAAKDKKMKKRRRIMVEILETERSYLASIKKLVDEYLIPMTAGESPICSPGKAKKIFGNIQEIIGTNSAFCLELEARVSKDNGSEMIGELFKKYAMFFKVYVMYTNCLESGGIIAEELLNDPKTCTLLSCPTPISTLRIQPIQRLPRYVLLLKELLKNTPEDHPDFAFTEKALRSIEEVADHVNGMLESHSNQKKVLEIQSTLWSLRGRVPELVAPHRRFIREGELKKYQTSTKKFRSFHVFLFSDMLVYSTEMMGSLTTRRHYHNSLKFYSVQRVDDLAGTFVVPAAAESAENCAFFSVTSDKGDRVFAAVDADVWIGAIQTCLDEEEEKRISRRVSLGKKG